MNRDQSTRNQSVKSKTRRKFFAQAGGAAALVTGVGCCPSFAKQTENILRLRLDSVSGLSCVRQLPVLGLKLLKRQQKAFVLLLEPSTATSATEIQCTLTSSHDLDDIFEKRPAANPFTLTQGQPELLIFKDDLGGIKSRDDKFKDTVKEYCRTVGLTFEPSVCEGEGGDDNDIHVEC